MYQIWAAEFSLMKEHPGGIRRLQPFDFSPLAVGHLTGHGFSFKGGLAQGRERFDGFVMMCKIVAVVLNLIWMGESKLLPYMH